MPGGGRQVTDGTGLSYSVPARLGFVVFASPLKAGVEVKVVPVAPVHQVGKEIAESGFDFRAGLTHERR